MRIDVGNGLNINYVEEGRGIPFVFTSGFTLSSLNEKTRKLFSSHFRVIQYDTRGSGESDDAEMYSYKLAAGDLVGLLSALSIRPGEAIVYGPSSGGVQAAYFARTYPEWPRALIIDGSATEVNYAAARNWRTGAEKTLLSGKDMMDTANLLRDPSSGERKAGEPAPSRATTGRYDPRGRASLWFTLSTLWDFPLTPHLHDIKCPTLYLHGDDDKIVGPGGSVKMFRATGGSVLKIVPKGAHIVLNNLPEVAKKEIINFLATYAGVPVPQLQPA